MIILLNSIFWLIITLTGYTLLLPIIRNLTKLEHIGLGLLVGAGIHSILYFFILQFSNLAFSNYYLLPIELTISYIISRLLIAPQKKASISIKIDNMFISTIGVIVGMSILSYTFMQATFWPVYEPDAIHLYDFRAKRLLENDNSVLIKPIPYEQNGLYPPYTSLFHLFSYQNGLTNPKVLYPILYISWYLSLIGYIYRMTNSSTIALWGANFIIGSPNIWWQSFQAMTNVPYMIYLTLGIFYLTEKINISHIIIGSLLVAISMFIRSEPFWIIPAIIVITNYLYTKNIRVLYWFAAPLIVYVIWKIANNEILGKNDQIVSIISPFIYPTVENYYIKAIWIGVKNTLNPIKLPFIIMISTFLLVKLSKVINNAKAYYWSAILIASVFMTAVINYSLRYPFSEMNNDSIYRMSIIMLPSIYLSIISNINHLKDIS